MFCFLWVSLFPCGMFSLHNRCLFTLSAVCCSAHDLTSWKVEETWTDCEWRRSPQSRGGTGCYRKRDEDQRDAELGGDVIRVCESSVRLKQKVEDDK